MPLCRALLGLLVVAVVTVGRADAQTVRYVLTADSRLTTYCQGCDPAATQAEPLTGSFDVSVLPGNDYAIAAVTGVSWQAGSRSISGSGFLQRFADGRMAVVLDTRFGTVPVLLTSGRRQPARGREIRLRLTSARGERTGFAVTLVAVPEQPAGPDGDGDGSLDAVDSCPRTASPDQADSDVDGIGNACDACPDTPLDSPVLASGCNLAQACPCEGPSLDKEWPDQRTYVQCVARTLKTMRQSGLLGKSEIRIRLQDAVRSGCGRRILAMG